MFIAIIRMFMGICLFISQRLLGLYITTHLITHDYTFNYVYSYVCNYVYSYTFNYIYHYTHSYAFNYVYSYMYMTAYVIMYVTTHISKQLPINKHYPSTCMQCTIVVPKDIYFIPPLMSS